MTYITDERLKSYLDTNQLGREQMCRSVLALDRRFSQVVPRHPRGGPDGARDIEARFRDDYLAFGAVGFVNQANDSEEQKKKIKVKFNEDVKSAREANKNASVFIFLTNINLTIGEKDELIAHAKGKDFVTCEIMDRERIRIALDSADGFSIRFQHLDMPLSESEQASFFAKWGDDIDSLISQGFQSTHQKLDRIIFLQESSDILTSFALSFQLKKKYSAEEIGHFRAFCSMFLKEPVNDLFGIWFGSSDRSNRFREDINGPITDQPSGIKHGISSAKWESYLNINSDNKCDTECEDEKGARYQMAGSSSSVGRDFVEFLSISYGHDDFIRILPRPRVKNFDGAFYMPVLSRSFAEKVDAIHVYANDYKIEEIKNSDFEIDASKFDSKIPTEFLQSELQDEWVKIRPSNLSSAFRVSFADVTPRKLFEPPLAYDSLEKLRNRKKDTAN